MPSPWKKTATYTIGEVSRKVGLSQKRIRDYEKAGFLKPLREKGTNNRIYTDNDVCVVERVKDLIHQQGFTLTCLKHFVVSAPCWVVFDCKEKETCPTFQSPGTVCYRISPHKNPCKGRTCARCPVYLNRYTPALKLF